MSKYFTDEYFKKYNWIEMQEFYDSGNTWKGVVERFNISNSGLSQAVIRGFLQTRSTSEAMKLYCKNNTRKHTDDTKVKLSKIRKEYLRKNPDKVPYLLNHSSKESYPEKYFTEVFEKEGLDVVKKFRVSLYELDFSIPHKKIDIEVDGNQHYDDVKIVKSDIRRTEFLESEGWDVIRVNWSNYQKLNYEEKNTFINDLKSYINGVIGDKPTFEVNWSRSGRKKYKCNTCGEECTNKNKRCRKCYENENRKIKERPDIQTLKKEVNDIGYSATGRKYGVSDNTIRKWINN
jgi:very-short-patch-repair endonuclease